MPEHDFQNLHEVYKRYFRESAPRLTRLKTGFPALDEVLGGGLFPGLVVMGGMPSMGKSTLALQIAAHMAENKQHVLYFSMEMPSISVLATAVMRKLYEDAENPGEVDIEINNLLDRSLTEEQREKVDNVMQSGFMEYLHICTESLSADDIKKRAIEFKDQGNHIQSPLVIVDYLQFLPRPRNAQNDRKGVEDNVATLKKLAHGETDDLSDGFPVLVLSSLNRVAYSKSSQDRKEDSDGRYSIQISSFKETGGIEYSADVLLGLQFTASVRNQNDINKEMKKSPRKVKITVLKNRYGKSGGEIQLQYEPGQARFYTPDKAKHDDQGDGNQNGGGIWCVLNTTKAAGELRKGKTENSGLVVSKNNISISYSVSGQLTGFDLCVADAIYSLESCRKKISLSGVLRVLLGRDTATITPKRREDLEASMRRLMAAELKLNCAEHLKGMKKDPWKGPYKGPFLCLEGPDAKGVWRRNEKADKAGILPLYTYGESVGQMIEVPPVLLDVKLPPDKEYPAGRSLSNTLNNIKLKWFLIRRLETLRNMLDNAKEYQYLDGMRTISFNPSDSLLQEVRLEESFEGRDREKKIDDLRKTTRQILSYYQKIGYISEIEEIKAGHKDSSLNYKIVDEKITDPWTLEKEPQKTGQNQSVSDDDS